MELIATSTRIRAKQPKVVKAITTTAGYRGWWTEDCEIGIAAGEEAIFRFGEIEVVFRIDRLHSRGIELTCVRHKNFPDWLGTHLELRAVDAGAETFFDLVHDGYAKKNDVYAVCLSEWERYLRSLSLYCESGRGDPQAAMGSTAPRKGARTRAHQARPVDNHAAQSSRPSAFARAAARSAR